MHVEVTHALSKKVIEADQLIVLDKFGSPIALFRRINDGILISTVNDGAVAFNQALRANGIPAVVAVEERPVQPLENIQWR